MTSKRERKSMRAEEKTPLLKAHNASSSSSSSDAEEEKEDKRALEELRAAIKERELAERRLVKKLREEMIRL